MHALTFQFKRAHLCAVAMGKEIFRGTKKPHEVDFDGVRDMTPARFDILHCIYRRWPRGRELPMNFISMANLRSRLGLSKQTISVAIERLVELGLVEKDKYWTNGRSREVFLTAEGIRRLKQAYAKLWTERPIARHIRAFVAKHFRLKGKHLTWKIDEHLDSLWFPMLKLARHLGNRSHVQYDLPYEPDH